MTSFCECLLELSLKMCCKPNTCGISLIHSVFKERKVCFFPCPFEHCCIGLCSISFSMIFFPNPEPQIWFRTIKIADSNRTYELIRFFIENKTFKCFTFFPILNRRCYKITFLINIWMIFTYIEFFIRLNKSIRQINKINSFYSKWFDPTARSLDDDLL